MGNSHRKLCNNLTKNKSTTVTEEQRPTTVAGGSSSHGGATTSKGQIVTPNLKIFTYAELRSATKNFRPDTILGEGGFGRVFKGWVDGVTYAPSKGSIGIPVAVKKSDSGSFQGFKEWQAEVEFLGKFSHPNLVKLLGYCCEDEEFLLVYEFMQKGSLENHLFKKGREPLSWETRIKIAIGAARGLAFLHNTERKVIYRDFKPSNVLLDGDFNAKLSDFGLAKLGPVSGESHVSTIIVGTYGYAAPEYMVTGLRVLDPNRPPFQQNLVDWARPSLTDIKKLRKIMDPRLEQLYPSQGVIKAGELIQKCLDLNPNHRPSMEKVVESLEDINAVRMKPIRSKVNSPQLMSLQHQQRYGDRRRENCHRSPLHAKQ